jgi:phage terminase large subunit
MEFKEAARPLIHQSIDSKKIIILKNGREVHGFSADKPDRIRNSTMVGFWVDEARECAKFRMLWDILQGRVLSTNGKGFITTSPNSYDDIHDIFISNRKNGYGVVRFPTYANVYLNKEGIDQLASNYDSKFAQQEIMGEFVIFQGAVYYTFNRQQNSGDLAFKVAQYDPKLPISLCCDFNIDPMAWIVCQIHQRDNGLREVMVIDEIYIKNCNTIEACKEFKDRYPYHKSGVILYGDATGRARHTSSNVTNWKIIEDELRLYGITKRVPSSNPAERDRVNALNGIICNSKQQRRLFVNPKCKNLTRDLEQVAYKDGTTQIDKNKDHSLTHASDALGYLAEYEFSLNKAKFETLRY